MLTAVVAMAHGNVIGKTNDLPWYLPADLKHFKELTTGRTVVMGRNTCDSIFARLGHALPNRKSIVITRDTTYQPEGVIVVHSVDEALRLVDGDADVIGGQQIYEQMLPYLDRLYVTEVDADIDGDTYFPELHQSEWQEVSRESHEKDDKNPYNYTFVVLDRIR